MTARVALTAARINAIPTPERTEVCLHDSAVRGLVMRIQSSGARSFIVRKWAHGRQRAVTLGQFPEMGVEQARKAGLLLLARIAGGEKPWDERAQINREGTITDLWEHFRVGAEARKRASSLRSDASLWRSEIAPWIGRKRISDVTRADVQRFVNSTGKETPYRANRVLALLSTMFSRGIQADMVPGGINPCKGVQRWREKSRDRFMAPDELRAFFQSLDYETEQWRVFFLASVLCGARRSNIQAMRWDDIDLDRGLWRVEGEQSKNGEPLTIIMVPQLVEALRHWRQSGAHRVWVFPSQVSKGHVVEPAPAWRRVLHRAEGFRLIHQQALHEHWSAETEAMERDALIASVGHYRLMALGRLRKLTDVPLELAVSEHRAKLDKLNINTGKSMLDCRLHDLRRTLGSWQALSGSSLSVIGKSLGHKSIMTTSIYARLDLDPVRASVTLATDAMLALRDSSTVKP